MPLVIRPWPITADAIDKMSFKAIDPKPDRLPADDHALRSQQVFNTGVFTRNR